MDVRAGTERLLARVVQVFGSAQAHHGYLFATTRMTCIKLLVHDGFGVWCAARRLNAGRFIWPREASANAAPMALTQAQSDALVLGLPWQRLAQMQTLRELVAPKQPVAHAPRPPKGSPQQWAYGGRRHTGRLRRSARLETVRGHHLGSLACKPSDGCGRRPEFVFFQPV